MSKLESRLDKLERGSGQLSQVYVVHDDEPEPAEATDRDLVIRINWIDSPPAAAGAGE